MSSLLVPGDPTLPSGAPPVIHEEIPILQYLLGLTSTESSFTSTIKPSTNLKTLPHSDDIKDVLFLSIDFEGDLRHPILPFQFQFGISILDTRLLPPLISRYLHQNANDEEDSETELQIENILQTYNFSHGPEIYCQKASRRLLFGEASELTAEKMKEKLETLIADRDVVLIVHGGRNDLPFLDRLNICVNPVFTIDTQNAAQDPLQLPFKRPRLDTLLTALEIPFTKLGLHTAGNDANFNLRVLLMIAVLASEGEVGLTERQVGLLEVLRGVARAKICEERIRKSQVGQCVPGKRLARIETKRRRKERRGVKKLERITKELRGESVEELREALELSLRFLV